MDGWFKAVMDLGLGMAALSKEKVEQKLKEWTDAGHLSPSEARRMMNTLVERGEQERAELRRMIQEQVQSSLQKVGLLPANAMAAQEGASVPKAAADESQGGDLSPSGSVDLADRVQRLEARVAELERQWEAHLAAKQG
ncbi:phasin family protein [Alicyclobacillus contaminans]|uniref:phasin family protein n=1 Tax=Alicyclobacillus contaminans TaxID=392016 RepID=UPI0003FAC2BA|nr:hypothetical protein [Alicyclobacillus contaminans]